MTDSMFTVTGTGHETTIAERHHIDFAPETIVTVRDRDGVISEVLLVSTTISHTWDEETGTWLWAADRGEITGVTVRVRLKSGKWGAEKVMLMRSNLTPIAHAAAKLKPTWTPILNRD